MWIVWLFKIVTGKVNFVLDRLLVVIIGAHVPYYPWYWTFANRHEVYVR
jgi:hypothetical protein